MVWDPIYNAVVRLPTIPIRFTEEAFELILALLEEHVMEAIEREEPRVAEWVVRIASARIDRWFGGEDG